MRKHAGTRLRNPDFDILEHRTPSHDTLSFLMTGADPEGAAAPPDGVAAANKKDLSNDQLKAYIHKARAKIRKLEEQNKASAVDAGETCRRRR